LVVTDKPNTLGKISTVFGDAGVGLAAMEMRTLASEQGEIAFLTHTCRESAFTSALEKVVQLPVVASVESWLRVED
ncbi:MAG: homoserine dehydrogenase, partial [Armatimonadetes bacterium]|nr:homoserine dehydrogenase [Armatimonadota bacterium]